MPAYPNTLPAPQPGWTATPRERSVRSQSGFPQARRRSQSRVTDVSQAEWTYTPEQMAIWWPWYRTDLKDGQLWFTARIPFDGVLTEKTVRFRPNSLRIQPLGFGIAKVTAELEIR